MLINLKFTMERKLLILLLTLFVTSASMAQITAGVPDDFDTPADVHNWVHGGGPSPNPPTLQTVGGVDNNYIKNTSTGVGGPGGRFVMLNTTQWTGNYIAAGIKSVSMQVRNNSAVSLNLRVAFEDNLSFTFWSSTSSVFIPSSSGWVTVVFPITELYMTQTGGVGTYNDVFTACTRMRILSSAAVNHQGDQFVGDADFDNITANTTFLSTKDQKLENAFTISPNPGRDRLNLKMASAINNSSLEIFDVLGKKIYADKINDISKSVDVSQWNTGVYLVRLTSETGTQTKRFIKQ